MKRWYSPIVVVFAFLLLGGCSHIQSPEFQRIEGFKVKNMSLSDATIGFNVVYNNPNNFGVTAKEAQIEVYLDNNYIGRFTSDQPITVPGNGIFSIPLTGTIPYQELLKMKVQQPAAEVNIKADGTIKLGKAGIFINEPIHYQGRHSIAEISKLYGH